MVSAARIKISGSGLPLVSSSGSTIASKASKTSNFFKINGAFLEAEAITQGTCFSLAAFKNSLKPGNKSCGPKACSNST